MSDDDHDLRHDFRSSELTPLVYHDLHRLARLLPGPGASGSHPAGHCSTCCVDNNGDTVMHGAAHNIYPLVVKLLAERGANPQIWKNPNKFGRTPLFIAEGYVNPGGLPRPDAPTIEAVTKLMLAAGLSTEDERPPFVDRYERPAEPPKPPEQQK